MNRDINNINDKIKLINQRSKPVEQGLVKTIAQLEHDPLMRMMMMLIMMMMMMIRISLPPCACGS